MRVCARAPACVRVCVCVCVYVCVLCVCVCVQVRPVLLERNEAWINLHHMLTPLKQVEIGFSSSYYDKYYCE